MAYLKDQREKERRDKESIMVDPLATAPMGDIHVGEVTSHPYYEQIVNEKVLRWIEGDRGWIVWIPRREEDHI